MSVNLLRSNGAGAQPRELGWLPPASGVQESEGGFCDGVWPHAAVFPRRDALRGAIPLAALSISTARTQSTHDAARSGAWSLEYAIRSQGQPGQAERKHGKTVPIPAGSKPPAVALAAAVMRLVKQLSIHGIRGLREAGIPEQSCTLRTRLQTCAPSSSRSHSRLPVSTHIHSPIVTV